MHDTSGDLPEASGPVERRELGLVVGVQSTTAALARELRGALNELQSNTAATEDGADGRIQEEGMVTAVRSEIDESDEVICNTT